MVTQDISFAIQIWFGRFNCGHSVSLASAGNNWHLDKIFAFDFLFTTCFDVRRSVQVVVSERMVKIPRDFRLHISTPRKVKVGAKIRKNILKIEPQQNFLFFGQFLDNITKCSQKSKQNDLSIAQSRQRQIVKMYKNIAPNQQRDCVSVLGWFHILYRLLGKVGSHLKALAVVDPKFVGLY